MQYLTYAEIKNKVLLPTDTQDEFFVSAPEVLGLCHDAIKECEAEIHTLYEDYFLKRSYLPLVLNQELYSLPVDIYGAKIRSIIYRKKGTGRIYPINRILDWHKIENIEYAREFNTSGDDYRYFLINQGANDGVQINLIPSSKEDSLENVVIYYLRQANRPEVDSDLIDIPEFYSFIATYMRAYIYKKEGHPNASDEFALLERERANMQSTLRSMVPDQKNEAPLDLGMYHDMSDLSY